MEAVVLSFEEAKQKSLAEKLVEAAQASLNQVAQKISKEYKKMDLENISNLLFEEGKSITGKMLTETIADLSQKESDYFVCPQTGTILKTKEKVKRTIHTRHGDFSYERNYFYNPKTGKGYYPLDQQLKVAPQKSQYDLQRLASELLTEMPFNRAADIFAKTTGEKLTDYTLHQIGERVGEVADDQTIMPSKDTIEKLIDEISLMGSWRPVLVVAADGAHMPTRPEVGRRDGKRGAGEWQEAKGFRIYLATHNKIVQLVSWHQIGDDQEFKEALQFASTLIPQDRVRIALVSDGARWVQDRMKEVFPEGKEILDYYHCSEHIHAMAKVQYKDDEGKQALWIESTMARLYYGEVRGVLKGLSIMKPSSKDAKEEIRKLKGYLERNRDRINYASASKSQMPKGSGAIESANKFICHVRMKRSGAWWYKINGNKMLRLRCALANATFDKVFEKYKDRQVDGSIKIEKF